jgi:hypothetical protein
MRIVLNVVIGLMWILVMNIMIIFGMMTVFKTKEILSLKSL